MAALQTGIRQAESIPVFQYFRVFFELLSQINALEALYWCKQFESSNSSVIYIMLYRYQQEGNVTMDWKIYKVQLQGAEWNVLKDGITVSADSVRSYVEERARQLASSNRPALLLIYQPDGYLEYAQQFGLR